MSDPWMYCRRCGIDGRPPYFDKEWNCGECFALNDAPALPCDNPKCMRQNCVKAREEKKNAEV